MTTTSFLSRCFPCCRKEPLLDINHTDENTPLTSAANETSERYKLIKKRFYAAGHFTTEVLTDAGGWPFFLLQAGMLSKTIPTVARLPISIGIIILCCYFDFQELLNTETSIDSNNNHEENATAPTSSCFRRFIKAGQAIGNFAKTSGGTCMSVGTLITVIFGLEANNFLGINRTALYIAAGLALPAGFFDAISHWEQTSHIERDEPTRSAGMTV